MGHPGRPPKFESPEQLQQMFEEWQATFTKDVDEIPDVEGFCIYLDTARQTLFDYEQKNEYSDTVKRIKDWIIYKKKQLAMKGKIPPAIYIFDAKNNAGYVDKQEIDSRNTHTVKFSDMDDEQLERAIQERQNRVA